MAEEVVYNNISCPLPGLAYEGASQRYKDEQRALLDGEADTLSAREVALLQMRSAHAIRNNGYARAAVDKYVTNLGEIKIRWKTKGGKEHSRMQELWDEFEKNPNLDGHGNFNTAQSVWHYSMFTSGNSFTRMVIRRKGNSNKIPLKLQGIPTQLHDIGFMGFGRPDEITRNGITFVDTKPTKYYFRQGIYDSPMGAAGVPYQGYEVPADEILHAFIRETPGQWIGIPTLASILIPLYELDELTDATIAKQKVAQAVAWVIENTNVLAQTPTGSVLKGKDKDGNEKIAFKAQGGNTLYLNKGEKLTQVQSGDIGPNLPVMIKSELFRICAAVGIPYHSLTGDTSGLNFASIRAIMLEFRTRIEYIHHFYTIPLLLEPLTDYFKALAVLYVRSTSSAYPVFQLPRFKSVDPLKDTQDAVLSMQNGLGTLQAYLDERHLEFEAVVEDRKLMETIGLDNVLMPNGANIAQAGNVQSNTNSSSN